MKLIFLLWVSIYSLNTFSAEYEVYSQKYKSYHSIDEIKYRTNPSLSRAWLEITIADDSDWEETWYETERVRVSGLYYDEITDEIKYEVNSKVYICATVRKKRGRRYIKRTSKCKFIKRTEKDVYDDGFYVKKVKRLKVFIKVK